MSKKKQHEAGASEGEPGGRPERPQPRRRSSEILLSDPWGRPWQAKPRRMIRDGQRPWDTIVFELNEKGRLSVTFAPSCLPLDFARVPQPMALEGHRVDVRKIVPPGEDVVWHEYTRTGRSYPYKYEDNTALIEHALQEGLVDDTPEWGRQRRSLLIDAINTHQPALLDQLLTAGLSANITVEPSASVIVGDDGRGEFDTGERVTLLRLIVSARALHTNMNGNFDGSCGTFQYPESVRDALYGMAHVLLRHGALPDVDGTLYRATAYGDFEMMDLLLAYGADPRQEAGRWSSARSVTRNMYRCPEGQLRDLLGDAKKIRQAQIRGEWQPKH